jgi:hypothetical protein
VRQSPDETAARQAPELNKAKNESTITLADSHNQPFEWLHWQGH